MKTAAPYLFCILFVVAYTWGIQHFRPASSNRQVYVLTSKVFNEFNGAKELIAKLKSQQVQQKKFLDSLAATITLLDSRPASAKDVQKAKANYQKLYEDFVSRNDEVTEEYNNQSWEQINKYVGEYAREKGYQVVFGANGSGSLMYADSTLNVSKEVIEYMNKRYAGN